MEISWFADLTETAVVLLALIGLVVVVFGAVREEREGENLIRLRRIGIGFLMMFLLVAYVAGLIHGVKDMSGVPIALENLANDEVFSVVDVIKSRDGKNLALIKGKAMRSHGLIKRRDSSNEEVARIVIMPDNLLTGKTGKSFFLKEIDGKVMIFPISDSP